MGKQKINTAKHRFNYIMVFFAGAITALLVVVVFNYSIKTPVQKDIIQMQRTCEASHQVFSGNLEVACGELIDKVQAQGFEVLNDSKGNFWAESENL